MTEKRLGKIERVTFGHGGYQDACLGLNITISGEGWGTQTSKSAWDANLIKHSEHCKWTEEERDRQYSDIMRYVSDLLKDAKVSSIDKLEGIPLEVEFEGNILQDFRILTEVL